MPATDSARPLPDALIHLTPIVSIGSAVVVAGHTDLWLAAFLPVAPLLIGSVLAGRRAIGRSHLISTIELATSLAVGSLVTYVIIWVGLTVEALALLIPVGILFALALTANLVFLTAAGAIRALRREVIEYPWVLPIRDRLPPLEETGFGQRR